MITQVKVRLRAFVGPFSTPDPMPTAPVPPLAARASGRRADAMTATSLAKPVGSAASAGPDDEFLEGPPVADGLGAELHRVLGGWL